MTDNLLRLEKQVEKLFKNPVYKGICGNEIALTGRWNPGNGWDICELAWSKGLFCSPGFGGKNCCECAVPDDQGALFNPSTVDGSICIRNEGLNYFLWGVLARMCKNQKETAVDAVKKYMRYMRRTTGLQERIAATLWGYSKHIRWMKTPVYLNWIHPKYPIAEKFRANAGAEKCHPCKDKFRGTLTAFLRMDINNYMYHVIPVSESAAPSGNAIVGYNTSKGSVTRRRRAGAKIACPTQTPPKVWPPKSPPKKNK